MWSNHGIFLVCVTSLVYLGKVSPNVHNVTVMSYDEEVADNPFIIIYFTDKGQRCELCGQAFPKIVTASQLFPAKSTRFLRCDDVKLMAKVGVDNTADLPRVGFLTMSHDQPRLMNEPITVDTLISHVVKRSEGSVLRPMQVTYEVDLTPDNFEQIINNKNYYTMVYLHAQEMDPSQKMFSSIAKAFRNDYEIVFATMDRKSEDELSKQFAILKLPALYWYDMTNKTKKRYGGQFEQNELVTFINDQTDLHRKPSGELHDKAGRVPHMEKLVKKHIDDIIKLRKLPQIIDLFERESGLVKNNRRFAEYYAELVSMIRERNELKVVDRELARVKGIISKGGLTTIEVDESTRLKNLITQFQQEVMSAVSRDKQRVREEAFEKEKLEKEIATKKLKKKTTKGGRVHLNLRDEL